MERIGINKEDSMPRKRQKEEKPAQKKEQKPKQPKQKPKQPFSEKPKKNNGSSGQW